jgi:hypothetical protein
MSKLRQLHAENVVLLPLREGDCRKGDFPMSKLRRLHAERLVLLPLLAGVIVSIIYLISALNRFPAGESPVAAEDHAAPPVSEDHQPMRDHG